VTLKERIARNDIEDQIYFGQLVERAFMGEFGQYFRALCESIREETLNESISKKDARPADRYLGRLEGISILTEYLLRTVEIKSKLQADKQASAKVSDDRLTESV